MKNWFPDTPGTCLKHRTGDQTRVGPLRSLCCAVRSCCGSELGICQTSLTQWPVIQPEFSLFTTTPRCLPPPTPQSTPSTSPKRTLSGLWRRPPQTRRATATPSCTTPCWRCLLMPTPTRLVVILSTWGAYLCLKDGLVSRASFSNLIDEAAAMPRAYGYAPTDADMWKNQEEKDASRQKMFDSMDLVSCHFSLWSNLSMWDTLSSLVIYL